jgi:hypothetical protein
MHFPKGDLRLLGCYVSVASVAGVLTFSLGDVAARDLRSARLTTRTHVATPGRFRASEGRVVEVRRASREIAIRTARGGIERIVIPTETTIRTPHGGTGLSGIRAGMVVHAEVEADPRERLVARKLSAR